MSNSCTTPTSYVTTPDYLIASCHLITVISFPIHVIGLYIILFKTPKAMSSIKWYFVNLHGWIVLYDNTMGVLFIPYLLLPSLSGFPLGLLAHIVDEFYMVVSLLTFCAYMQLSILALFENRFYIICEFSWKVYWEKVRRPWIVAHYIYTVVVFIPMAYMLPDQEVAKEQVLKKIPCVPEYVHNAPVFTLTDDWTYLIATLGGLLLLGVLEGAFFILTIIFYIGQQLKNRRVSRKTVIMQIKFLLAVLIQTFVPVIMMVLPLGYVPFSLMYNYYNQIFTNLGITMETMHGLFSTLTTIFIHQPYRKAFFGMLPKWARREVPSSVHPYQPNDSILTTQT